MRQGAQGWCTGMTLRDGMGREVGGEFRMGNTCTSMADSCQCMAAAAVKLLQSCPTLCNPIDGSPTGSLSLGFSRQEYWSGLPFPSPMHESEK